MSKRSMFTKAEVPGMSCRGQADDDVIDKTDLHDFRSFAETAGEIAIRGTRLRIAGGMVVHNHKAVGSAADHMVQHVARMSDRFVNRSAGYFLHSQQREAGVEKNNLKHLLRLGPHFGA